MEFFAIYSRHSSLLHHLKTFFNAEVFWESQTSRNQREPALICKDDVAAVTKQTDWLFSLLLLQYDVLHYIHVKSTENWLGKVIMHNFRCYTYENSLSSTVIFLSGKMYELTESNISGVLDIVDQPGFFFYAEHYFKLL